jgi:hypothetical protein
MNLDGFVTVNGIVQSSSEYHIDDNNNLVFRQAPAAGDCVNIILSQGAINSPTLSFTGNGTQNVFFVEDNNELMRFNRLIDNVRKHRDTPAVKDLLEQLQVVTELLR